MSKIILNPVHDEGLQLVSNLASEVGLSGLATSITAGKTLTLTAADNYTLTIPATGTAALLGINNNFTRQQFVDGSQDEIQLRVQANGTQTANIFTVESSGGGVLLGITANGRVANSVAFTTAGISASDTVYDIAGAATSDNGGAARFPRVLQAILTTAGAINFGSSSQLYGLIGGVTLNVGITTNEAIGLLGRALVNNASSVTTRATGLKGQVSWSALGAIGISNSVEAVLGAGSTAINGTTAYLFKGTLTGSINSLANLYGFYIDSMAGATNNYAIYTNKGLNRLGDQLLVDGSADRIQLRVQAHSTQTTNLQTWENSSGSVLSAIDGTGAFEPASLADSAAPNNSIYYSTTASKLVYKDAGGTVNNLY